MSAAITVYRLGSKFVNRSEDIPEDARQVVYYSLAIGHHVGVLDCFEKLADIPLAEFQAWISELPLGPGRTKLEGVLRYGEIEINRTHASALLPLLQAAGEAHAAWTEPVAACLQAMFAEPALYLMLRKRPE